MGTPAIHIEIGGTWSASDFERLFAQFNTLAQIALFTDLLSDEKRIGPVYPMRWLSRRGVRSFDALDLQIDEKVSDAELREVMRYFTGDEAVLQVVEIEFASPGFIDLAGVGKAFEAVSAFVLGVTDRVLQRKDRKLARDLKEAELFKARLENAEKLLSLTEKYHIDSDLRHILTRKALGFDEYIEDRMIDRRVTDITKITR